jgi:hypothetical protein
MSWATFTKKLLKTSATSTFLVTILSLSCEIYETFESDINTIFDKHVPIKEMYRKNNQLPYMNRELRKAIYNKKSTFLVTILSLSCKIILD